MLILSTGGMCLLEYDVTVEAFLGRYGSDKVRVMDNPVSDEEEYAILIDPSEEPPFQVSVFSETGTVSSEGGQGAKCRGGRSSKGMRYGSATSLHRLGRLCQSVR